MRFAMCAARRLGVPQVSMRPQWTTANPVANRTGAIPQTRLRPFPRSPASSLVAREGFRPLSRALQQPDAGEPVAERRERSVNGSKRDGLACDRPFFRLSIEGMVLEPVAAVHNPDIRAVLMHLPLQLDAGMSVPGRSAGHFPVLFHGVAR